MPNNDIGYHEDPRNSDAIIRARTTKQIRSWEIPRTMKALEVLNNELGKIEFPGIYILFEGKNKVYVGEAKNIYNRYLDSLYRREGNFELQEKHPRYNKIPIN
jgi:hypothetical protein